MFLPVASSKGSFHASPRQYLSSLDLSSVVKKKKKKKEEETLPVTVPVPVSLSLSVSLFPVSLCQQPVSLSLPNCDSTLNTNTCTCNLCSTIRQPNTSPLFAPTSTATSASTSRHLRVPYLRPLSFCINSRYFWPPLPPRAHHSNALTHIQWL